jgi:hypothetical protein
MRQRVLRVAIGTYLAVAFGDTFILSKLFLIAI